MIHTPGCPEDELGRAHCQRHRIDFLLLQGVARSDREISYSDFVTRVGVHKQKPQVQMSVVAGAAAAAAEFGLDFNCLF